MAISTSCFEGACGQLGSRGRAGAVDVAMKVYTLPLGIVLGLLCVIPLINVVVLLAVNGKATAVLKQNGIRVGLLGANIASI